MFSFDRFGHRAFADSTPVHISAGQPPGGYVAISAGYRDCALSLQGEAYCWEYGEEGGSAWQAQRHQPPCTVAPPLWAESVHAACPMRAAAAYGRWVAEGGHAVAQPVPGNSTCSAVASTYGDTRRANSPDGRAYLGVPNQGAQVWWWWW